MLASFHLQVNIQNIIPLLSASISFAFCIVKYVTWCTSSSSFFSEFELWTFETSNGAGGRENPLVSQRKVELIWVLPQLGVEISRRNPILASSSLCLVSEVNRRTFLLEKYIWFVKYPIWSCSNWMKILLTKVLMKPIIFYRQLRARRALLQLKDVLMTTRRALLLYKVNCNSALLALNWRYLHYNTREFLQCHL